MELGVARFLFSDPAGGSPERTGQSAPVQDLLAEIELADAVGLSVFGIGEHHSSEFLDSSPVVLLSAGAARTKTIRLSSAATVLSTADPVRTFQDFATLDLVSNGRAEIVAGRGSSAEAFSLFGVSMANYDAAYSEKLDLLLKIRAETLVSWRGHFRPALSNQGVYPRPVQQSLPIWLGVGGSPQSCVRAGTLGLPLALGVLGGTYDVFQGHVGAYREAARRASHSPGNLRVGINAIGYVGETMQAALDDFYGPYDAIFSAIGRKAGWPALTRQRFAQLAGPEGALIIGGPEEVANKVDYINRTLGGVARISIQMSLGPLPYAKRLRAIELLGTEVSPRVNRLLQ